MPPDLIAIRTRSFDAALERWSRRLLRETRCRVAIVADESHREVPVPRDLAKIAVSGVWARRRGLHTPADAMWRCGDYALYAAREAVPDAPRVWLVDDDVRINADRPGGFFDPGHWPGADLLAVSYRRSDADWPWYGAIKALYRTPYRCWFPIVRLSAAAIDGLRLERVSISRGYARPGGLPDWPNDESFVATYLTLSGYTCKDLNDGGRGAYDARTFSWRERPFSEKQLDAAGRDGKVYHPVLCGRGYLEAMRRALEMKRRRARSPDEVTAQFDGAALAWVAAECGADASLAFAGEVEAAARTVPRQVKEGLSVST